MEILSAGALYFAIVFGTGFVLGPVRVLFIEPWVGSTLAVMLEAPILLVAMVVGARIAMRWSGVERSAAALLTVGALSLVLQQIADVALGILLRGMTLRDHLAQFATAPGMIYGALLVAFLVMPLLIGRGGVAPIRK